MKSIEQLFARIDKHIKSIKEPTEQDAYNAGFDAAVNGANINNCHFSFFMSEKLTIQWEAGNNAGLIQRSKRL